MAKNTFKLRYLPLFEQDLMEVVAYICNHLQNREAADSLITKIEKAILKRLATPLSFEPFHSTKYRQDTYYRIYVGNFSIFYVVLDDVMEVRRLIYGGRDIDNLL